MSTKKKQKAGTADKKQDKPTVHTNDTGGTWIDARELFTTTQGRRAIEGMIGPPPKAKQQKKQA
jgi:hypothetical protein